MKYYLPLLFLLSCLFGLSGNVLASPDESREVLSEIDRVTVFLDRAQVFRSAAFRIPTGQFELIIDSISPMILPSTLQVKGLGDFTILEARHQIDYRLPPDPASAEIPEGLQRDIIDLQDSLKAQDFDIQWLDRRMQALDQERAILQANPLMGGADGASDTIPELRQSMDFFRERLLDIQRLRFEIEIEKDLRVRQRSDMQSRLNQLLAYQQRVSEPEPRAPIPVHQIKVTVLSERAVTGTLECSYAVNGASWSPAYDIRSSGPAGKVELTYKANVRQQTHMDWDGVPLTLSTYDPTLGQTKPELPVWYVDYFTRVTRGRGSLITEMSVPELQHRGSRSYLDAEEDDEVFEAKMADAYLEVTKTFSNLEFTIDLNYSIPSDGSNHLVLIKEEELDASYVHYLVPKLAKESFIAAQVTGWEDLDLLPGLANIFYDGTYIGQANLDPETFGDTLDLPMGRDRLVLAERKRTDRSERIKVLSGQRVVEEAYSLRIRNRHPSAVHVILQDHLPVAMDDDIQVKLEEGEVDRFDVATGLVEWEFDLPSRIEVERDYAWSLKHDKDKSLGLSGL